MENTDRFKYFLLWKSTTECYVIAANVTVWKESTDYKHINAKGEWSTHYYFDRPFKTRREAIRVLRKLNLYPVYDHGNDIHGRKSKLIFTPKIKNDLKDQK